MKDPGARFSTLWIFAMFNYLYCDILGVMDSGLLRQYLIGQVAGMQITQEFLLGGAVLMEIPIAMIVLSRVLRHRANRRANIVAGAVMTVVQCASLLLGSPTIYYGFLSVVEIACTSLIVILAWTWRAAEVQAHPSMVTR
jgi:Family of unknown function (DUF6326)